MVLALVVTHNRFQAPPIPRAARLVRLVPT